MITEKSYRIPAVHRLLLAAAPFLVCVIFLFLFDNRGVAKKQRPSLSSKAAMVLLHYAAQFCTKIFEKNRGGGQDSPKLKNRVQIWKIIF